MQQKAILPNAPYMEKVQFMKRWFISWITGQNVQKLPIFAIFASISIRYP